MKKIFSLIAVAGVLFLLSGCASLNKQANYLKALEDCKFEIKSVDSIYIANVNMNDLLGKETVDLVKMPRFALAFLRKSVPLKAKVNLAMTNPTSRIAGINQFEYKVLIKDRELAGGFVSQKVSVSPNGGITTLPIEINSNIYHVLSDDKAMDAIMAFLIGAGDSDKERKGMVTIKLKPTLDFGNKQIKYPGYITINKEISSKNVL